MYKPFTFEIDMKNMKGEALDTKEKNIVALVHTANFEQIPISSIWIFDKVCYNYDIDKDNFFRQDRCEECAEWGIVEYRYDDGNFKYSTKQLRCCEKAGIVHI